MKKSIFVTLCCSLSFSYAAEVRFYQSFSEIQEKVKFSGGTYTLHISPEQAQYMLEGSLGLQGVEVISQKAAWVNTLKVGQTVYARDGEAWLEAEVVNVGSLLLKDKKTGYFLKTAPENIKFTVQPEAYLKVQMRTAEADGAEATFSHLNNGIMWQPRYTLVINNDQPTLTAWAEFTNNTPETVKVDQAEMMAGDVRINAVPLYNPSKQIEGMAYGKVENWRATFAVGGAMIAPLGEDKGVYAYKINEAFELDSNGSYSVPFLKPEITLKRVASVFLDMGDPTASGNLSRTYEITANEFLPSGKITVREGNRMVGQGNIQGTAKQKTATVNVGIDPDVGYERSRKINDKGARYEDYQITITLSNSKNQAVDVRYQERYYNKYEITNSGQGIEDTNNTLSITTTLKAGEKQEYTYTVRVNSPY